MPKNIGKTTACKWARNNRKKNKFFKYPQLILNLNLIWRLNYLKSEIYHWPTTTINNVRTRGKAGYRVLKLAGGQGDHAISLPFVSFEDRIFFVLLALEFFVANPFPIVQIKNLY